MAFSETGNTFSVGTTCSRCKNVYTGRPSSTTAQPSNCSLRTPYQSEMQSAIQADLGHSTHEQPPQNATTVLWNL